MGAVLQPAPAAAQQRIYNGWYHRVLTLARLNPRGLFNEIRAGYRLRTNQGSTEPLFLNQHYALSGTVTTSPAFVRPGILAEAQPLSVLYLFAQYEVYQYFGTFDILQSFDSLGARYSDAALAENARATPSQSYATTGHQVTFGATLQIKIDAIAVRSAFRWAYMDINTRQGAGGQRQPYWYDPWYDILAPSQGWVSANDTDVLYMTDFGLIVGARYSLAHAWYGAACEPECRNTPISRVGPLVMYQLSERRRSWFNAPTIIAAAQWWLHHPYRAGGGTGPDDGNRAIPYVLLGFMFRGDL